MPPFPSCAAVEEDRDTSSSASQEQLLSGRKASCLDNHMPSLKRKRTENGTASLCVEYDQGPTSSRRQPVGLLDALELNERKSGEADEEDGLPGEETAKRLSTLSLQYEKRLLDEQKGNKKKLKIITHLQVPDPSEPKKARAASFIAVVKQSLSQLNFDTFSRALQQYKNTNDFDAMLSQMSALFLEDQKKHLFQHKADGLFLTACYGKDPGCACFEAAVPLICSCAGYLLCPKGREEPACAIKKVLQSDPIYLWSVVRWPPWTTACNLSIPLPALKT
ncbi:Regulator of telomere elongation helicase 1 [Varanus komodoensis]|nr:Regulator of telomere elongation helicase 1 [Varanus komodoensis]